MYICVKATGDKEDSIYCEKCNLGIHNKCNNLNYKDYKHCEKYKYSKLLF